MAQQDTDQQHVGVLPVDDEGYVIDTEDCEEREAAWRERGTSRPITVVGNPVPAEESADVKGTSARSSCARRVANMSELVQFRLLVPPTSPAGTWSHSWDDRSTPPYVDNEAAR
ncbi:hypothetical protein SFUMM280S_04511 [Streptomyces fumanus]